MITGADRVARRARAPAAWPALLALWLFTLIGAAAAAESAPDASFGVEQLMQRLAQVKSARATFVERKHLRVLNAPLEMTGTLVYTAPGYLEKHTLTPKPESLILDKETLTFEDRQSKRRRTLRLQQYPVVWAFVESIRATLAGDVESLKRFYRLSLAGSEADWRLTLDPREPDIQRMVREIRISGSRASVRTIEITETEGDRSVMTITETK
jgi:outer membrane lipoprotein-sorting protein